MLELARLALARLRSPEDYRRMQRYLAEGSLHRLESLGVDLSSADALELGAGPGGYSPVLADACRSFVASDMTRAEGFPEGIAFAEVDVQQPFPFPDDTFDFVYCSSLIEHVADPAFTLAETHRVLRPGGHLHLSFPPYWSLLLVGGHDFKPFHLLGERAALWARNRRTGDDVESMATAYDGFGLYPLRVRDGHHLLDGAGFETVHTYTRMSRLNTAQLPGVLADLLTWHVCYLARRTSGL